jgi:hypothetical protein
MQLGQSIGSKFTRPEVDIVTYFTDKNRRGPTWQLPLSAGCDRRTREIMLFAAAGNSCYRMGAAILVPARSN